MLKNALLVLELMVVVEINEDGFRIFCVVVKSPINGEERYEVWSCCIIDGDRCWDYDEYIDVARDKIIARAREVEENRGLAHWLPKHKA